MDINEIVNVIGSGFFPVVMCGIIFWYMVKQMEAHKEETNALADVINKNTQALIELKQMIQDRDHD